MTQEHSGVRRAAVFNADANEAAMRSVAEAPAKVLSVAAVDRIKQECAFLRQRAETACRYGTKKSKARHTADLRAIAAIEQLIDAAPSYAASRVPQDQTKE